MAKETEIKKPVISRLVMIKSANMTASKVGTAPVFSIPIPSEYEKIGLSNEQRDKVRSIVNRYDVQIQNMETLLNSMKTNRAKELSNVLTSKQQSELANGKTPVPSQAKPEVKRSNTSKNDKTVASVAPASKGNTASKDKAIKKAEGKK